MGTIPLQARRRTGVLASRRLLRLAGDDRLVTEMRLGNEAALEVAYERHGRGILSFCRHMLGSPEEAEDVVQHAFAAAWSDLQRNDSDIRLKPWLYAIARNRCLSVLRSRRPDSLELEEDGAATAGLSEQVSRRADLRELLADLRDLPDEQRAALVLSELEGLSHADVAEALGRKEQDVKALVFRARSSLGEWRRARETPCQEVREQLSVLSGGSLRRSWLRRHLQTCEGCREFRDEVRNQGRMMAVLLPVAPSAGLKSSVLAAAGLGGSATGGAAAAGGLGAVALSSVGAKIAVVAVVAGGAVTAGERALDDSPGREAVPAAVPAEPSSRATERPVSAEGPRGASTADDAAAERRRGARDDAGPRARSQRGERRRGAPGAGADGRGAAPVETPARAKGSPPAVGRVRRGLAPPPGSARPTEPKGGGGRPAEPPGAQKKAAQPAPPEPAPKTLAPGQLPEKRAKQELE